MPHLVLVARNEDLLVGQCRAGSPPHMQINQNSEVIVGALTFSVIASVFLRSVGHRVKSLHLLHRVLSVIWKVATAAALVDILREPRTAVSRWRERIERITRRVHVFPATMHAVPAEGVMDWAVTVVRAAATWAAEGEGGDHKLTEERAAEKMAEEAVQDEAAQGEAAQDEAAQDEAAQEEAAAMEMPAESGEETAQREAGRLWLAQTGLGQACRASGSAQRISPTGSEALALAAPGGAAALSGMAAFRAASRTR